MRRGTRGSDSSANPPFMHSSNGSAQTTPAPRSRNRRDTRRGRIDRSVDEDVEELAIGCLGFLIVERPPAVRIFDNGRTTVERLPTSHRGNDRMPCATMQSVQAKNSPCHLSPGSSADTAARTVCCGHFSGQSRAFFLNIAAAFSSQDTPHPVISGAISIAGHFSGRPHFGCQG